MPPRFRPPKPNWIALGLGRFAVKPALRWLYGIVSVEYDAADLERLSALRPDRVLIVPNHPTNAEPIVMFHLSRLVRMSFYFVSNRESFDRVFGLFGKLLQGVGAYSIIRGAADLESFSFTRKLLAEEPSKLVIFPEGEVYSQNDTLLPFHDGVFGLAASALEQMRKKGVDAPLYIQPAAMKYRYVGHPEREIARSLERLETALGVRSQGSGDPYQRLLAAGERLLASAEAAYHIELRADATLQTRIDAVREAIIARVAEGLGVDSDPGDRPLHVRMRALFHRFNAIMAGEFEVESVYEARLAQEERHRLEPLREDLRRLANWVAVRDAYVQEKPTVERFIDTLRRMEVEVLGGVTIKAKKRCIVRLGEPFDLRSIAGVLEGNRKVIAAESADRAEAAVQQLLDGIGPDET